MNEQKRTTKEDYSILITGIIVFVVIILLWIITRNEGMKLAYENRSSYGDMFGSVNALFSGLAFGGIIITILLQRKELALQRQELADTREELKRSATAQEKSEHALLRQAEFLKISSDLTAYGDLFRYYSELSQTLRRLSGDYADLKKALELRKHYLVRFKQILKKSEALEGYASIDDAEDIDYA